MVIEFRGGDSVKIMKRVNLIFFPRHNSRTSLIRTSQTPLRGHPKYGLRGTHASLLAVTR